MQETIAHTDNTFIHTHDNGSVHTHDSSAPHTHGNHTHTHTQTKAVLNRLAKIGGHVNSVRRMVEDGRDCSEVLIQLAAIRSAVNGVCKVILQDHIDHCLVDAVETGDMEAISALNQAISMLMK
ncbi:MAG: metal-sensing transcriptional repressor [Oscillospiraceae bacterium]|jgi:DNA-binding FrmR family transcriptional regulator